MRINNVPHNARGPSIAAGPAPLTIQDVRCCRFMSALPLKADIQLRAGHWAISDILSASCNVNYDTGPTF
jgi:hypothetical protein